MSEQVPEPTGEAAAIPIDGSQLPDLLGFYPYHRGDKHNLPDDRRKVALWTNRHRPQEEKEVVHDWEGEGHGFDRRLGEKVLVLSRTVVRDGQYVPIYRVVPFKNISVADKERGKLFFDAPVRLLDTQELSVDEIRAAAGLPVEGWPPVEIEHPVEETVQPNSSDTYDETVIAEASADDETYSPTYSKQLFFELAGDFLTNYQYGVFAPYRPPAEKIHDETDLHYLIDEAPGTPEQLPARWMVTDESVQKAIEVLHVARTTDQRIDSLLRDFISEYHVDENNLPLYIRTEPRLRYRMAEYLLEKLESQANAMPTVDLPYQHNGRKKPDYEGYEELVGACEYTVLLALSKLDGTFKAEFENKIREGEDGTVWEGKFRVAANRLLSLRALSRR